MLKIRWTRGWVLIGLMGSGALLTGGGKVQGYTEEECIGGDLYIDFYNDTTHAFEGYIRVRNSSQCVQNQYPG